MKLWSLFSLLCSTLTLPAADWPQWMGPQRDGIWREEGLVRKFPESGPKVLWETPCGGGYAGPAVAEGRVFLADRIPAAPDAPKPENPSALPGTERLRALDSGTGKVLWEYQRDTPCLVSYPAGPRATPVVHEGLVYFLGIHGRLACLEAATGKVMWEKYFEKEFNCEAPMWGFAGHPVVFRDTLICLAGGKGSCVVAFDLKTGAVKWKSLTLKQQGYAPPTICDNHGQPLLIQWSAEAIHGLDPVTGRELWDLPWPIRNGVAIASPVQSGNQVLITSFWRGCRMLKLNPGDAKPDIVWETEKESDTRTVHLNALMTTPVLHGGNFYGVCSYGQIRGLRWEDGTRLWENKEIVGKGKEVRWATAFLTWMGGADSDHCLCFTESGELLILKLTPAACEIVSRAKVIEPDCEDVRERPVVWTHPAYANGHAFVRNNHLIRCLDLRASPTGQ
ncbi:MAG: PQQ-binding-like beta-propeller repeat protein [Verrucomicrobiota bacterium]